MQSKDMTALPISMTRHHCRSSEKSLMPFSSRRQETSATALVSQYSPISPVLPRPSLDVEAATSVVPLAQPVLHVRHVLALRRNDVQA